MNIDIHDAVITAVILAGLGALWCLWAGFRTIARGKNIQFFRIRRERIAAGLRLLLLAVFLGSAAFGLSFFGEPVAYRYFPPSPTSPPTPTVSTTPTISQTPTISPVPSITPTLAESYTPTVTPTPFLPLAIEAQFISTVTPNPEAIFSPLAFATRVVNANPVNPATIFRNPVGHMFAVFSYNNMLPGSQWTALWYRDGELVYYETLPWDGEIGGYGFSDWEPDPQEWLPGTYQVQIFVGLDWEVVGEFVVEGDPYTPTNTRTPTATPTPSRTPTMTPTPTRTLSPRPTDTLWPTATAIR
ncbi:MAG: hypothetical protein JXB85_07450 [Anaerolineales bacterium]|nr:hypothetical protein [Anaerolineales bacterium]